MLDSISKLCSLNSNGSCLLSVFFILTFCYRFLCFSYSLDSNLLCFNSLFSFLFDHFSGWYVAPAFGIISITALLFHTFGYGLGDGLGSRLLIFFCLDSISSPFGVIRI